MRYFLDGHRYQGTLELQPRVLPAVRYFLRVVPAPVGLTATRSCRVYGDNYVG